MDKAIESLKLILNFEKRHFRDSISLKESLTGDYEKVMADIQDCMKCRLHLSAKNKVPGSGSRDAEIMVIGEAPGEEEDKTGKPFVGRAGKKLDEMLSYISLKREDVFICNVLKCRPPDNSDPTEEQQTACIEFLSRQIDTIKPKVILTLGRHAASAVLKKKSKVMHDYLNKDFTISDSIRVVATYHPAAILYSKGENRDKIRAQVAFDLKRLERIAGEK